MKKFFSAFLSLIMAFALLVPAFAVNETAVNSDTSTDFVSETFYFDAETGEILSEDGEPIAFEDVEIQMPVTNDSDDISTQADLFELYLIRSGLQKSSGGKFTWWFNVDCPTSPFVKPNITLTAQVKGNFTNGIGFSSVGISKSHTYKTNEEYSVDYTWTTTAKTGYYYIHYTLTDHDAGQTKTDNTESKLFNRTGHVWNFYFSDTGKSLPMPRADWTKGTIYQRPNGLNDKYYQEYAQKTGKTLNKSLYDVHHIQPLSYGGDNSYSNLIHLPKDLHSQVTGWFNGY